LRSNENCLAIALSTILDGNTNVQRQMPSTCYLALLFGLLDSQIGQIMKRLCLSYLEYPKVMNEETAIWREMELSYEQIRVL